MTPAGIGKDAKGRRIPQSAQGLVETRDDAGRDREDHGPAPDTAAYAEGGIPNGSDPAKST